MDENLARWIFASVAKHFEPVATGLSLPLFVEGIDERTDDTQRADHAELRLTGPYVKEASKNYWLADVQVNLLFTSQMVMGGADAYNIVRWCGKFQSVMLDPIPVYQYGDSPSTFVGCLKPVGNSAEAVRVYHFGQLDSNNRIRQSEVDALYRMEIST
jgi:hypothetical protein